MGKAYASELAVLGTSYAWATSVEIAGLKQFVAAASHQPLIAVGSGGSLTAAHLASLLHRHLNSGFARHATPLDLILSEPNLGSASLLLFSASGRNRDIQAALETGIRSEARAIGVLSTKSASPVALRAENSPRGFAFAQDIPAGKDGFLATNSLLASCVVACRAFGAEVPDIDFSKSFAVPNIAAHQSAHVLFGGWAAPVATDLESKLNESAMLSAQVCDFRNFGHGRHFWFAQRPHTSLVIALITPETESIATRTINLLPSDVLTVHIRTQLSGPAGTLDLLVQGFRFMQLLGVQQGFDPGRPVVPEFGKRLYHLAPPKPENEIEIPILRKLRHVAGNITPQFKNELRTALTVWTDRLKSYRFRIVVFDYDGTLCGGSHHERSGSMRADLAKEFIRFLDNGITIGVATGRGRSVRAAIRAVVPESYWDRITVGYYNGGQIAALSDDATPSRTESALPPLDSALALLNGDKFLSQWTQITPRASQLTIEPLVALNVERLVGHVMYVLGPIDRQGVRVLASTHSIDVVSAQVSKLTLIEVLRGNSKDEQDTLCIGDRGQWPGNDYALLSRIPSVSVDDAPASESNCWNLAPPGIDGPDATLVYLRAMSAADGEARFTHVNLWRDN